MRQLYLTIPFLLFACGGASPGDEEGGDGDSNIQGSGGTSAEGTGGESTGPTGGATASGGNDSTGSGGQAQGSGGAVQSSGCGSNASPTSGTFTINVDGTERMYIISIPDGYDAANPYPIVFAWHPLGGDAEGVAADGFGFLSDYYGLKSRSNNEVIFVSGDGLENDEGQQGWWNTGGGDVAFFDAMLERFKTELCVDEARLFSTGFSFGGMMSDLLACERGQVLRAIAPMAGRLNGSFNSCVDEHVPAMIIHGTQDGVGEFGVPIEGAADFRDYLIGTNNCEDTTSPVDPSPCVAYQGCDPGYPITWCAFEGAHTIPDFASEAIWDFFSQFL